MSRPAGTGTTYTTYSKTVFRFLEWRLLAQMVLDEQSCGTARPPFANRFSSFIFYYTNVRIFISFSFVPSTRKRLTNTISILTYQNGVNRRILNVFVRHDEHGCYNLRVIRVKITIGISLSR